MLNNVSSLKRQSCRALRLSKPAYTQPTLSRFGFTSSQFLGPRPQQNVKQGTLVKSDHSGTWVLTAP